jgi:RHS repeat-associated protein
VVAVTSSSGSVTNSYSYDPFGVTTETKATLTNVFNPWRYTGQYQDSSTGMYKMGARYYQPELGRWTQRDPSGLEANAYLYVGGNPVNFTDPTGLLPSHDQIIDALQLGASVSPYLSQDWPWWSRG